MNYFQLSRLSLIASLFSVSVSLPVAAETIPVKNRGTFLKENQPAKTVKEWLAQVEETQNDSPIQVSGVKLNQTKTGLEIILETQDGKPLAVDASKFRAEGNTLIADIPNAVLMLPSGRSFEAINPVKDVTNIAVTYLDATNIRVSVTGAKAPPTTEVVLKVGELAYSLNQDDADDEEIVVRGEGQRGYYVPDATTGTRTDTPLRDTPRTIQVVPKQVLQDQAVIRVTDALRNVSGVVQDGGFGGTIDQLNIRGFSIDNVFVDGFRTSGWVRPQSDTTGQQGNHIG